MPSRFPTRRQLLGASAGCLSVALAGCSDIGMFSESAADDNAFGVTREYESLSVRTVDERPIAYPDAEAATDDGQQGLDQYSGFYVIDSEEASTLQLTVDGTDAADVREFLDATDFESESIVVDQRRIGDCYRRRILAVYADIDTVQTRYCSEQKAPMTPCKAEKIAVEALFVRVHRSYNERPSSRMTSEEGPCPDGDETTGTAGDSTGNETDGATDGSDSNGTDGADGSNRTDATNAAIVAGNR